MILMAGFTAGNEKGELVVLGRNAPTTRLRYWPPACALTAAKSGPMSTGVHLRSASGAGCAPAEIDVLSGGDGALLLWRESAAPAHHRYRPVPNPCLIKNTGNPQAPGTLIGASRDEDDLPVKGISNLNNMAMFNVSGPGMKGMVGMAARVFATMSRAGISVVLITQSSSEYSISFCVPQSDCARAKGDGR